MLLIRFTVSTLYRNLSTSCKTSSDTCISFSSLYASTALKVSTALVLTIPGIPGSIYIVEYTEKVNLLALTTHVLAYAGISTGNSWLDFAKLGWKTIVVGIVVLIGTYLGSAVIAEIVLRIQGVI